MTRIQQRLTPRQFARAIGVSESSIKRWCDKGLIETEYTAGGHRRIPIAAVTQFLRNGRHELGRPELLGLPEANGSARLELDRAAARMTEMLVLGAEQECRNQIFGLYLAGHSVSTICDEVLVEAFREIGECWQRGSTEVFQERRACEIILRVLHELRLLQPSPPPDAPLALGGAPAGDRYDLPAAMVDIVLRGLNWQSVSLGNNLPFATLKAAIANYRPRLFWLSVSLLNAPQHFLSDFNELREWTGANTHFVIGGRALDHNLLGQLKDTTYCANLQQLESHFDSLHALKAVAPAASPKSS